MKSLGYALLALPLLALGPMPALAQTASVSVEDALRIARDNGLSSITKIEMDDGKWEVEGVNATRQRVELDIDPASGKVLKTDIDN